MGLTLDRLSDEPPVIKEINLAIIGSRSFNNYELAKTEILKLTKNYKIVKVR
jgi:hypothetical protein